MVPNQVEWMSVFQRLFSPLNNQMMPASSNNSFQARTPLEYNSKGEANYRCEKCNRTWSSINGLMTFEYRLKQEGYPIRRLGKVALTPLGQQCQKCNGAFVQPEFTVEAIEFSLGKLLLKVKEKFYGEAISHRYNRMSDSYAVNGRGSHNSALCEGCQKGKCQSKGDGTNSTSSGFGKFGHKSYNPNVSPSLNVEWILEFK